MRSDGSEFPVELVLSQVEGEPLLICGALRDLTQQKRAEQDLRRLADEQEVLRHVATLVARGYEQDEIFHTICLQAGRLVDATKVQLVEYGTDGMNLTLAEWNRDDARIGRPQDSHSVPQNAPDRRTDDALAKTAGAAEAIPVAEAAVRSAGDGEVTAVIVTNDTAWGAIRVWADHPLPTAAVQNLSGLVESRSSPWPTPPPALNSSPPEQESWRQQTRLGGDCQRDIHDGAQAEAGRIVDTSSARRRRVGQDPSASAPKTSSCAGICETRTGQNSHGLAAGLHPTVLTRGGLGAALDALAARSALPVTVEAPDARYPSETEVAIYFLVGEALANAAKHAQASRVDVVVTDRSTHLALVVRDDGAGGATLDAGGGLRGLQDRAVALGGTFSLLSTIGEGTLLPATLPLPVASNT